MWGRIEEYQTGRWRLRGTWAKNRITLYRYVDGKPLFDERLAIRLQERISSEIDSKSFDPQRYLADSPFLFEKAAGLWIGNSVCSEEWKRRRRQVVETIFNPFFGKMDIRDIRSIHIDEFHLRLKQSGKWADKTIYNIMGELRAMLRKLSDNLVKVPVFPRLTYQVPAIRMMTHEHQEKVFEFIPEGDKPIFLFLRYTGCRLNEARGLLRQNLFPKEGYLVLSTVAGTRAGEIKENTKTKKVKVFPITPQIEETLKPQHLGNLVFMHFDLRHKRLKPYSNTILWRIWTKANQRAHETYGIPIINPYNAFRHSFGCQRLSEGVPLAGVQQMLGHTSIKTTQRYAEYDLAKIREWMTPKVVTIGQKEKTGTENE